MDWFDTPYMKMHYVDEVVVVEEEEEDDDEASVVVAGDADVGSAVAAASAIAANIPAGNGRSDNGTRLAAAVPAAAAFDGAVAFFDAKCFFLIYRHYPNKPTKQLRLNQNT
jgi:hypothetical protein